MSLYMSHRFRELLRDELPERDDFDEAYELAREVERDGGEGTVPLEKGAAVSLSPEEES